MRHVGMPLRLAAVTAMLVVVLAALTSHSHTHADEHLDPAHNVAPP